MRYLIGLILVLVGLYMLGKNVIFTTRILPFWYQDISAMGSVVLITFGIIFIMFLDEPASKGGWILIILGLVIIFANARVFLRPTSLWTFLIGFASMFAGFKFMSDKEN